MKQPPTTLSGLRAEACEAESRFAPAFRGTVYGLGVGSDIALPDLSPSDPNTPPDIRIARGELDWRASGNLQEIDEFLRGRPGEIWMNIPGKLIMLIEEGRAITYQPYPGVAPTELRAFLLGSGLGALMTQRGNLVLHANAIAMTDGSAIICMGTTGAGKSTTAAALMLRGFHVLADDVCPIGKDDLIHPGLARMKLWDETAAQLRIATDGLELIPGDRAKWNIPLVDRGNAVAQKPGLLVLLDPVPSDTIRVAELTGFEKFSAVRNNIYRPLFNRALGTEPECLKRVAEVCDSTRTIKLSRPERGFHIDALVDKILEIQATYCLPADTDAGTVEAK